MSMLRVLLVAIMIGAPGAWLVAQDQPAPPAGDDSGIATDAADAPEVEADEAEAASDDEVAADEWEMPALPPGFDDDSFIPTEEVAADEEVIFPVDI
jgi:hypothetical protein